MSKSRKKPVQFSVGEFQFKSTKETSVSRSFRGYLNWGNKEETNGQPKYLTRLYKSEPHHQGIVDGKAKYISGLGIKASTPQGEEWLKKWNPGQKAQDVLIPTNRNYTLFGARAIKIVPNLAGMPLWFFHIDFSRCRISECETMVYYCDDWDDQFRYGVETYPIWYKGCKEPAIYLHRRFNATTKSIEAVYPGLEYESCIKAIDTLTRIDNSRNSLVINDFSTGTAATIFASKPESKEDENKIVDKIKGNYTGDEQQGKLAVIWADEGGKAVEFSTIPSNDLDKKYLEMTSASIKSVYAGHQVPPELFKYIKDGSSLFENKEIILNQQNLFIAEYVDPEQQHVLEMLKTFFEQRFPGQTCDFEIEQFDPIGADVPLDNQTVIDTLNKLDPNLIGKLLIKKYKLPIALSVDSQGNEVAPVAQAQVNDHLKNLTGKQMQGIDRIVRKYKAGTYSQAQATLLLQSGFGLTEEESRQFLGAQEPPPGQLPIKQRIAFAKEIDFMAALELAAHDVVNDDILEVKYFDGRTMFAADGLDDKTKNDVLNAKKNNPEASNEDISNLLDIPLAYVVSALEWIAVKKLLTKNVDKKATIYTEYNYVKRPDVSGPTILPTTRDWCRWALSKFGDNGKALLFKAIDKLNNEFGMNAWDFRGGFYNDGKETTPWCRHIWRGTTKVKYE